MDAASGSLLRFNNRLQSHFGKTGSCLVYMGMVLVGLHLLRKLRLRLNATPIRGSVCVVTGASQGIGASLAEQLVANGAKKVVLVARTESKLQQVAERIHKNLHCSNRAIVKAVDCSNYEEIQAMAESIISEFGIPQIIINCAGAGKWRYLFEMDADEIKQCMDAPYLAASFVCKAFLPDLIRVNTGTIVNVQSPVAYTRWGGATAYAAGRWALRGLSEALKADLSSTNIRVQEVILGEVNSEYFTTNQGSIERIPKIARIAPAMTTEFAAKGIINAIRSGEAIYSWGYILKFLMFVNSWCPSLISSLLTRTGWQLKQSL